MLVIKTCPSLLLLMNVKKSFGRLSLAFAYSMCIFLHLRLSPPIPFSLINCIYETPKRHLFIPRNKKELTSSIFSSLCTQYCCQAYYTDWTEGCAFLDFEKKRTPVRILLDVFPNYHKVCDLCHCLLFSLFADGWKFSSYPKNLSILQCRLYF